MAILFDHITSALIGGVVVMMLFGVQMRMQKSSIERTLMYTAKKQTLSMGEVLERDLVNMGYERNPNYQRRLLEYDVQEIDGETVTETFKFWGLTGGGMSMPIKYEVEDVGDVFIDGTKEPLLKWRRFVCTALKSTVDLDSTDEPCQSGAWEPNGASTPTLTKLHIEFLKSNGNAYDTSLPDEELDENAHTIQVWLYNAVAPSAEDGNYLEDHRQLYWRVTLRPGGLLSQS